jgi:hypothetical protein
MLKLSFKPKSVTKRLLQSIPERPREVLTLRYGLGDETSPQTLESIGEMYGITRERVRQIENHGIALIRRSASYKAEREAFEALEEVMHDLGVIVHEDELLSKLSTDQSGRNHIHFLLVLGDSFFKGKEDEDFHRRWYVDSDLANVVHKALKKLASSLSHDDLVSEKEIVNRLFVCLGDGCDEKYLNATTAQRWLSLSKLIGKNPLNEWGRSASPNIKVKGIRDYAYLALKRHGSPMHFGEVAKAIEKTFGKKAHVATTHNELIKDKRFVLVGRGLYALTDWGYTPGIVKTVIRGVLEKEGPLDKNAIVKHVQKERYVKDNTILVNLQDSKLFKRMSDGKYALA